MGKEKMFLMVELSNNLRISTLTKELQELYSDLLTSLLSKELQEEGTPGALLRSADISPTKELKELYSDLLHIFHLLPITHRGCFEKLNPDLLPISPILFSLLMIL